MKKFVCFSFLLLFSVIQFSSIVQAQKNEWVNQVIIANGGKYEFTPPYSDVVSIQTYNPTNHTVTVFDHIGTQSVQDLVIRGNYAYVAAQDSIVMYNIDTYTRVAAIPDSGLNKLAVYNDRLIVSKQYPIKRFFVEVLDATNLGLIARVQGISGECSGITTALDTAYVAVDSGYLGTHGKLAVLKTSDWTLVREIDLGEDAVGIHDLYNWGGNIYCINKTPYGGQDSASITRYNYYGGTFHTQMLDVTLGNGVGIVNNLLFTEMNNGIGNYNLQTEQIVNPAIVPDPGAASHMYILKGCVNYIDNQLYVNIGNQTNFGIGIVTDLAGDSITSFTEGVSAEAMAVDYRTPVGFQNTAAARTITVFPNPADQWLNIRSSETILEVAILDPAGRKIFTQGFSGDMRTVSMPCATLVTGLYLLEIRTAEGTITSKFMKK